MTKEEKTLLTKVLCEQLPYNVKVHCKWFMYQEETPTEDIGVLVQISNKKALVKRQNQTTSFYLNSCGCSILPYLRPLFSLTEEEQYQLGRLIGTCSYNMIKGEWSSLEDLLEFVHKNHIDIFGLIPKGLAIAAVGENNPYKEEGGEK